MWRDLKIFGTNSQYYVKLITFSSWLKFIINNHNFPKKLEFVLILSMYFTLNIMK